jgi:ATP-dependent DNA helicase RecG
MDISQRPVTDLKGVGPRLASKLERLGLTSVQDLLFHLPFRYQDRTRITAIGALRPGDEAVVVGQIGLSEITYGRRRSLLSRISDGTGALTLRFFHFSAAQQDNLARGRWIRCFGEARRGPASLEMIHPEYELFDSEDIPAPANHLTPFYPTTEGLHQLSLRKLVGEAVNRSPDGIRDWLPPEVLADLGLPTLAEALAYVHNPPPEASTALLAAGRHPAQQRLAFEELLAHHLSLRRLRARRQRHSAPAMDSPGKLMAGLLAGLPFALTAAQQRVVGEIVADLRKPVPMQRLLQGDVGSGKTVVAAAAAARAVEAGYQVAVMAPTEILAEQHLRNFQAWLAPLGIEVVWLAAKLKARERNVTLDAVASGRAAVAVGTHALFQEAVVFDDLGLLIVDEQHRFGVHQRLALREKGSRDGRHPHQLIMTATPIPRTLAMTFYADLDLSVIDELPPGRTPVETVVVQEGRRDEVLARVSRACAGGRQAYWVCPVIEESETLQVQAAKETEAALREAFPDLAVGLVHGRMKPAEKEAAMTAFKAGEVDLLVATTVIEVGVDVPNASLMIIENSERLGLSQLHQLRGRVGRGAERSTCVLMYHPPLSEHARIRLATMRETTDGFEIARRDLELRGPGEVLGTRQTGLQSLRIADLLRDQSLLPRVERTAELMQREHPDRVDPLIRRWLGQAEQYGDV